MLRYGIPAYRLPRDVLAAEIDRILALGVELRSSEPVTDLAGGEARGRLRRSACSRSAPSSRTKPKSRAARPPT